MRFATSAVAVAAKSSSSGGFLSWLTGDQSSSLPPLDSPLAGVNIPSLIPDYVEPARTKITTLPNGVKIASEMSPNPSASIGIYVDCGSIYETPRSTGATHLLEHMAFKSTTNRSHLRIVRELEAIGGHVTASASREQMAYSVDALKTYIPQMVEMLVDCVKNPASLDGEVNGEVRKVKTNVGELSNNPQGLILEALHSAGYSGALANPLLAPESALNTLTSTILSEFVAENYTASRMVLAAYGVEHDMLLSLAEPLLSDIPGALCPIEPKSVYVGGDYRCQSDIGATHFALAFEVPGGWYNEKEAIVLTVLQMLMGGDGSFSAGGPGKGMHSRLYARVLNQYPELQSCSAFNSLFSNTGIFGIYATTDPSYVSEAIDVAAGELLTIAIPGQVNQVELCRTKEATKSAVLMNLESRTIASEDIGRQVLTYGERKPLVDLLKVVDEITLEDITDIAKKLISTPLTMASYGDVTHVPSYESVDRKFHSR